MSSRLCSETLTFVQRVPSRLTQGPTISSCSGRDNSSWIIAIDFYIILKVLLSLNRSFWIGLMKLRAHSVCIDSVHEHMWSAMIGNNSSFALSSCMYLSRLLITYTQVSQQEATYTDLLAVIAFLEQEYAALDSLQVLFGAPLLYLFRSLSDHTRMSQKFKSRVAAKDPWRPAVGAQKASNKVWPCESLSLDLPSSFIQSAPSH